MTILILIFVAHFLGDFVFQSDGTAKNKSKYLVYLVEHTLIYGLNLTGIFLLFNLITGYNEFMILPWICINVMIHGFQDYFTSRLNKFLFSISNHYGFVGIGLDQMIHHIILILTYQWMIGF